MSGTSWMFVSIESKSKFLPDKIKWVGLVGSECEARVIGEVRGTSWITLPLSTARRGMV